MERKINDLIKIVDRLGFNPAYFQGGGGNISVKIDEKNMAIKASGIKVSEVRNDYGLAFVDYLNIRSFYDRIRCNDFAHSAVTSTQNISDSNSRQYFSNHKPSIETGFHALLGNFIIHSHSVYANFLSCCRYGEFLAEEIFPNSFRDFIFADYFSPGFFLTIEVKNKIKKMPDAKVIFLKNHGLIISSASAETAILLHEKINEAIRLYFFINSPYPRSEIIKISENKFFSNSDFLVSFIKNHLDYFRNLYEYVLFPDQVVFCDEVFVGSSKEEGREKIFFDLEKNKLFYNTNYKEAKTIDEVLLSWAFIIANLEKRNLPPMYLRQEEVRFIDNMESEKYRKSLLK